MVRRANKKHTSSIEVPKKPAVHESPVSKVVKKSASSHVPETTREDRARLGAKKTQTGSAVANAMLHESFDKSAVRNRLGKLWPAVRTALAAAPTAERREAERALMLAVDDPYAERGVIAALTGRVRKQIKAKQVARYSSPTVSPAETASALARHWRHNVAQNTAAFATSEPLQPALYDAIVNHENGDEIALAARFVRGLYEKSKPGRRFGRFLVEQGLVSKEPAWAQQSKLSGSLVLALSKAQLGAALADTTEPPKEPPASEAALGAVTKAVAGIRTVGLLTPEFLAQHPSRQRGGIAEELRLIEVRREAEKTGDVVVQGIEVFDAPAGLRNCRNQHEAQEWARKHGHGALGVQKRRDENGQSFFALVVTEIDVAVFRKVDGKLRPIRFENVKAGTWQASKARKQNDEALERLRRQSGLFLFPGPNGLTDRTQELDRSGATLNQVTTLTVGPTNADGYDLSYGLSSAQLTELQQELTGEA